MPGSWFRAEFVQGCGCREGKLRTLVLLLSSFNIYTSSDPPIVTPHILVHQLTSPFQSQTSFEVSNSSQQQVLQTSAFSPCLAKTFHTRPPAHQGRSQHTVPAVPSAAQQIQMRIGQRYPISLSAGEFKIVSPNATIVSNLQLRLGPQELISKQARSLSVVLKISSVEQDHPQHPHHNHMPRFTNPPAARANSTEGVQIAYSYNHRLEWCPVNTHHRWMTTI